MTLTTNEKGRIGEAAFQLWCAKRKYFCSKAPEAAPYDFFFDQHTDKILRVQVKYRTPNKDGRIEIKLKPTDDRNNNYFNYVNGSIDAIAIFNSDTEEIAIIPVEDLPTDQNYFFLLCRDSKRNNDQGQSRLFKNYVR